MLAEPGAQVNGIHEVMGSIPISSTNSGNNLAGRPSQRQSRCVYAVSIFSLDA
jgi:hypothetical protein